LQEFYVNQRLAKNVILFIGDGMGISTITAARLLKGELNKDTSGIEKNLVYEDFPHAALSKVTIMSSRCKRPPVRGSFSSN
jgi:alkaline phosphatase